MLTIFYFEADFTKFSVKYLSSFISFILPSFLCPLIYTPRILPNFPDRIDLQWILSFIFSSDTNALWNFEVIELVCIGRNLPMGIGAVIERRSEYRGMSGLYMYIYIYIYLYIYISTMIYLFLVYIYILCRYIYNSQKDRNRQNRGLLAR